MSDFTREELAWAAGFFDGEGSFWGRVRSGPRRHERVTPNASVPQMGSVLLERFRTAVLGLGRIYGPYEPRHGMCYWRTSDWREVQAVVAALWPWLGPYKRQQARETMLAWRKTKDLPRWDKGHPRRVS